MMTLEEFMEEWNNPFATITVHTSGSTGKPKAVQAEKSRMLASSKMTSEFLGLHPGDTALLCMPLDYIAGKMMVVRSIERHLNLISVPASNHPLSSVSCHIDFAAMVPSQVYCTLENPKERERFSKIGNVIIGGGAIPRELETELAAFPNRIWHSYGMTETLSHIALRRVGAGPWFTPFDSVSLSSDNDNCLVISAPIVHDGILCTNDIAQIRSDGTFRILGRRDNVICSGGIKLQMEEIEEKLRPCINGAFCITKRPDPKFGETVVLIMEKPQTPDFSVLDPYSRPKMVVISHVPLTGTGKIDRSAALRLALSSKS